MNAWLQEKRSGTVHGSIGTGNGPKGSLSLDTNRDNRAMKHSMSRKGQEAPGDPEQKINKVQKENPQKRTQKPSDRIEFPKGVFKKLHSRGLFRT